MLYFRRKCSHVERILRLAVYQQLYVCIKIIKTRNVRRTELRRKLLFKILNSGDFRRDITAEQFGTTTPGRLGTMISEKGLRYDLTVPFARFVVQHRNEITFPFKRYQIQPVWRADRPQRGRYREFYQCDVDVIGSDSLLNEHELVTIMDQVFTELGLGVVIRINNDPDFLEADLRAMVIQHVYGLFLPKAEDPALVKQVDRIMSEVERERGLAPNSVKLMPMML